MKNNLIAFGMGLLFGLGLCVSAMINPSKVLAFLDIFGAWDPSLAFVMAGALLVTGISFRFLKAFTKPLCAQEFQLPTANKIDRRLIIGSALFGIGWGLAGICPGPAVVALTSGVPKMLFFFASLIVGILIFELTFGRR